MRIVANICGQISWDNHTRTHMVREYVILLQDLIGSCRYLNLIRVMQHNLSSFGDNTFWEKV